MISIQATQYPSSPRKNSRRGTKKRSTYDKEATIGLLYSANSTPLKFSNSKTKAIKIAEIVFPTTGGNGKPSSIRDNAYVSTPRVPHRMQVVQEPVPRHGHPKCFNVLVKMTFFTPFILLLDLDLHYSSSFFKRACSRNRRPAERSWRNRSCAIRCPGIGIVQ